MDYNSLPNFYAALDAKYNVTNNELNSATYTNVDCNFVYSAKYARHRWFNYKEGFSPILVEKIFNEYKLNKSSVVCDPFCGAGTTVAVAKAKGMKSIGFEVNPFAAFITKVKTENYSKDNRRNSKNSYRSYRLLRLQSILSFLKMSICVVYLSLKCCWHSSI